MSRETDQRFVEQECLVNEAYPDSSKLDARRQIYRFLRSEQSFPEWLVGHLGGSLGRLLDVGCGPGFYMGKVRPNADLVVGIDLSAGMAREAKRVSRSVAVADAESLPFAANSFDTTLCIHMLYHVANIPAAARELRRVTRMGGLVAVVTNGADHMRQIRDDFDSTIKAMSEHFAGSVLAEPRRFRMEDGNAILQPFFDHIGRDDMRSNLEIPEVEPIERYLESIRSFHEPKLPRDVTWGEVLEKLLEHVHKTIEAQGVYRITTHSGVLLCK